MVFNSISESHGPQCPSGAPPVSWQVVSTLENLGNDSPHPSSSNGSCKPKVGVGSQADGQKPCAPKTIQLPASSFCHPGLNRTLPSSQPPAPRTLPLHKLPLSGPFSFHHRSLVHSPIRPPQAPPSHSNSQQSEASDTQSLSNLGPAERG